MAAKVSSSTDGGYDFDFVEDVPDDFLCVVCHMVLRQPVMVVDCGHKFCEQCYEKMKVYSASRAIDLLCPLDQAIVDLKKVFPDKYMERKIFDLQVYCNHKPKGCQWSGELRCLQDHLRSACLLEINTCQYSGCDVQMEREELKEHEKNCIRKVDPGVSLFMTEQIKLWEEKFEKFYTQQNEKISALETKIANQEMELTACHAEINKQNEIISRLQNVVTQRNSKETEVDVEKCAQNIMDKLKQSKENKSCDMKESNCDEALAKHREIFDRYETTLMNMEKNFDALLVTMNVLSDKNPYFTWYITDYSKLKKDKPLYSPVFYSSLKGYCLCLYIKHTKAENQNLGLFFQLKTTQYQDNLEPFDKKIVFQCSDVNGRKKTGNTHRYDGRLCCDLELQTGNGHGFPTFLNVAELEKFIINDTLMIKCWLE